MPRVYADSPIRQESCGGWDIQKGQPPPPPGLADIGLSTKLLRNPREWQDVLEHML